MSDRERDECIEHDGIVKTSGINSLTVSILPSSACSGCHAAGSCTLSGKVEKLIDIEGSYNLSPGDKVTLIMKQSAAYSAVLLGYILPFLTVLAVLLVMLSLSVAELTAGLISIFSLIPYYFLLWFLRKRIGKKFTFTIKN
ncbi:MAG TPA: SoxR reducing system RseC family protein [Bacteroidales bacterium]|nr:SoxR reducing system RseC family protein [Bacteroidales bacterium]HPF03147.1 SoxR reducing system RseC family protein [Bacteroidales bacterium]HPJ59491.1 SoxR reducing system RseC family protein [Bacteroidales bacterium]HPR12874.1 SoxR reducing system RseC family protein [Bacteroidales bacterium]HRW85099.1 SoxR reducing system RseC family protein [Bacteroidales bacterium]